MLRLLYIFIIQFIIIFSPVNIMQAQDFLWAKDFGGLDNEYGRAVTTDGAGNVYITGFFEGTADFDPGTGVSTQTSAGGFDIFISKFDPSGNLIWAKSAGGTGNDYAYTINLDSTGNIFIAGRFDGTADFDPGAGIANRTSNGSADIFVLKLSNSGNYIWAKSMGGIATDQVNSIAVDAAGNIYGAGVFNGTADMDPGAGTHNVTSAGGEDLFVLKLDVNGDLIWVHGIGNSGNDRAYALTKDAAQNLYLTGVFSDTTDFDPGAGVANLISVGNYDVYILKLDSSGAYQWAKNIGSTSFDFGYGITTDNFGNVYTTGYYQSTADFDPGAGIVNMTSAGSYDIFIQKMDTSGNFIWARSMGGAADDRGYSIVTDDFGDVYLTGYFIGTVDFDPDTTSLMYTSAGMADFYVFKADSSGNMLWTAAMGGANHDFGLGIALDKWRNIYTTGNYEGTADFDPSSNTANLTPEGGSDVFLMKLNQCLSTSNLTITACDSYISPGGNIYNNSGTYTDTVTTAGICDSIVILNLTINESITGIDSAEICKGNSIFLAGAFQHTAGIYFDSLSTVNGCDSVIVTNLIVNTADTSVTVIAFSGGNALAASDTNNIAFQWLDCNNNHQTVPGATSVQFIPNTPGLYAVEVTSIDGCVDTSSCYTATPGGMEDFLANIIHYYPNPVIDQLIIETDHLYENIAIEIISIDGKVMQQCEVLQQKVAKINTKSYPEGIYLIKIKTEEGEATAKFVKISE